jgi:hypothetical protein
VLRRAVALLLVVVGGATFIHAMAGFGGGEAVAVLGLFGIAVGASLAWNGSRIPPDPKGDGIHSTTSWDGGDDSR